MFFLTSLFSHSSESTPLLLPALEDLHVIQKFWILFTLKRMYIQKVQMWCTFFLANIRPEPSSKYCLTFDRLPSDHGTIISCSSQAYFLSVFNCVQIIINYNLLKMQHFQGEFNYPVYFDLIGWGCWLPVLLRHP